LIRATINNLPNVSTYDKNFLSYAILRRVH
jgi:hypothetical protein